MLTVVRKAPNQVAEQVALGNSLNALQAAVDGSVQCVRERELPGIDVRKNEKGKLRGLAANAWLFVAATWLREP